MTSQLKRGLDRANMHNVHPGLNLTLHQQLRGYSNIQRKVLSNYQVNRVICADAKLALKKIPDSSMNLVYLDPPFFTNRNFESCDENAPKSYSFSDKWDKGISGYIEFMRQILKECHRVTMKSGSLFLHCDWHASHYLKVTLDSIFGYNNFRNEIVWRRHNAHNDTKQGAKMLGKVHDVILFYSKTRSYTWNPIYQPYTESYVKKFYRHSDSSGRKYALGDLSGPGGHSKGNPYYNFLGVQKYWRYNKSKMKQLFLEGKIIQTRNGTVPMLKRYLDEMPGIILQDVWDEIPSVQISKRESVGYPTQKPIRLLERIIELTTDPGEVVLDPFCGSGTALLAARNLNRKYLGIDVQPSACKLSRKRLKGTNTGKSERLLLLAASRDTR